MLAYNPSAVCMLYARMSTPPPPLPCPPVFPHLVFVDLHHRQAGAEVDAEAKSGVTALWLASGEGRTDVLKQLLESGASANNSRSDGITALMGAAAGGHGEVVNMLLKAGVCIFVDVSCTHDRQFVCSLCASEAFGQFAL